MSQTLLKIVMAIFFMIPGVTQAALEVPSIAPLLPTNFVLQAVLDVQPVISSFIKAHSKELSMAAVTAVAASLVAGGYACGKAVYKKGADQISKVKRDKSTYKKVAVSGALVAGIVALIALLDAKGMLSWWYAKVLWGKLQAYGKKAIVQSIGIQGSDEMPEDSIGLVITGTLLPFLSGALSAAQTDRQVWQNVPQNPKNSKTKRSDEISCSEVISLIQQEQEELVSQDLTTLKWMLVWPSGGRMFKFSRDVRTS